MKTCFLSQITESSVINSRRCLSVRKSHQVWLTSSCFIKAFMRDWSHMVSQLRLQTDLIFGFHLLKPSSWNGSNICFLLFYYMTLCHQSLSSLCLTSNRWLRLRPAAVRENSEVEKLEDLHRRRNLLAAYCKMIIHGVLEMSMAAEVFMNYVKVKVPPSFMFTYQRLNRGTVRQCPQLAPVLSPSVLQRVWRHREGDVAEEPSGGSGGECSCSGGLSAAGKPRPGVWVIRVQL